MSYKQLQSPVLGLAIVLRSIPKNGLSNCYRITTNCVDLVTFKRTFLIKIILMIPSTGKSEKLKSSSYKDLKTAAKTSWFKYLFSLSKADHPIFSNASGDLRLISGS